MNLTTFASSSKTKTVTVNIPTGTYTYPVEAVEDAYWTGSTKINNDRLKIGDGNTSYLKYNIPSLPGNITGVNLECAYSAISYPNTGTIKVSRGTNTNWTEMNLSNSNKPSINKDYGAFNTNTSTIYYSKSITTSDVSEGGTLNLILTSTNTFAHDFASTEDIFEDDRPRLILTINNSANASPSIQTGKVNVVTASTSDWDQVTFPVAFATTPIVVIGPPSFNGSNQSTTRVRKVTKTGFQVQVDEWDYLDGGHASEAITYIAAEAGTHDLGGVTMKAASIGGTDHNWKTVTYASGFSATPMVMATQVSNVGSQATVVRLKSVNKTSFRMRLQEEEANDGTHGKETVHYMAFSTGSGSINGKSIKVASTGRTVQESWVQVNFGGTFSSAGLVATAQSTYGSDAMALRYKKLKSTGVQLKVEEEKSKDTEVDHTTEIVGYVVIANVNSTSNAEEDETNTAMEVRSREQAVALHIEAYPNPFVNVLNVVLPIGHSFENVELLDINARVIKHRTIGSQDTSLELYFDESLTAGTYFLRLYGPNQTQVEQLIKLK